MKKNNKSAQIQLSFASVDLSRPQWISAKFYSPLKSKPQIRYTGTAQLLVVLEYPSKGGFNTIKKSKHSSAYIFTDICIEILKGKSSTPPPSTKLTKMPYAKEYYMAE